MVDYSTGSTFDPEKPWFIFFYYRKCNISQKFKLQYEELARELSEDAQFGMVDVMEAEMLKETYAVKATPFFVMLKGDTAIEYENSRSKEAILQFIRVDHAQYKKRYRIPEKTTRLSLFYRYLERYVDKRMPIWDRELDDLGFRRLGLQGIPPIWKIAYAVAFLSALTFMCLIMCFWVCINATARKIKSKELIREKR